MVASATLLPLLFVALRAAGAITGPRATVAPSSAEAEDLSQIAFGAEGAQWAVGVGADDAHDDEADASTPPRKPWPPHHPHYPPKTDKTIYQVLNSTPQYSIIAKLVNLNNATIDLLNQTETNITFFAPPNYAFPKRHHEPPHKPECKCTISGDLEGDILRFGQLDPAETPLVELVAMVDAFDSTSSVDDDDDRKKRLRRIIKRIVRAVVAYHVIPKPLSPPELAVNTTYATNLTIGHGFLDGEPLRVRVQPKVFPPGVFNVNILARTIGPELSTANGVVYKISLPLLPPPSIFQELFLASSTFSIATTAFQRVGITAALERVYKHGSKGEHGTLEGSGAVTVFVPTNRAFERLPFKLRLFLFSPLGQRVLGKLLQYHVVPGVVFHSDYFHNATDSAASMHSTEDYDDLPERPTLKFSVDGFGGFEGTIAMTAPSYNVNDSPQPYASVKKVARIVGRLLRWRSPRRSRDHLLAAHTMKVARRRLQDVGYPHEYRRCDVRPPVSAPLYERNFTLPTLLTNTTLNVTVSKHRVPALPGAPSAYFTRIVAGGRMVALADGVANNGAVHILNRVLNPLRGKTSPGSPGKGPYGNYSDEYQNAWVREEFEDENEWEGWEDWLVRWALDE